MIIKAKHNFFIYNFFQFYTKYQINKNFFRVIFHNEFIERNLPILIISNHSTWWDGFWIENLNLKFFKRKFHFMMLEEQLKKYWYFNYCGGYSVSKNTKSILESLNYTIDLLKVRDNLVLMFPEGKLYSLYNEQIKFEKGIIKILQNLKNEIQLLFVVNKIEYFSNPKLTLFQYIKEYDYKDKDYISLQNDFNKFYQDCLMNLKKYQE